MGTKSNRYYLGPFTQDSQSQQQLELLQRAFFKTPHRIYNTNSSTGEVEVRSGVQGHMWLHSEFESSMGYLRPGSKGKKDFAVLKWIPRCWECGSVAQHPLRNRKSWIQPPGLAQAGIPSHREMVSYNMTALYSHWDGHKGKAVDKEEGNQSSAALLDCKTAQALRTACFPKMLNTDIL